MKNHATVVWVKEEIVSKAPARKLLYQRDDEDDDDEELCAR